MKLFSQRNKKEKESKRVKNTFRTYGIPSSEITYALWKPQGRREREKGAERNNG